MASSQRLKAHSNDSAITVCLKPCPDTIPPAAIRPGIDSAESLPPKSIRPASSGAGEVSFHSGIYGSTATKFSEQVKFWKQKLLVELGSWEKGISITSKARAIFSSCRIPSVPAT